MSNILVEQSCSALWSWCSTTKAASKFSIITGVACEAFSAVAYPSDWISLECTVALLISGGALIVIGGVALTSLSYLPQRKEHLPILLEPWKKQAPFIRESESFALDALPPKSIALEDLDEKCPLDEVKKIYQNYRKELSVLNSKIEAWKLLANDAECTYQEFLIEKDFFSDTFLKEELWTASKIIARYRCCHYKPDLMPILPVIYRQYHLSRKSQDETYDFSSDKKKKLIKAIVEQSCQIDLSFEVIDFFFEQEK